MIPFIHIADISPIEKLIQSSRYYVICLTCMWPFSVVCRVYTLLSGGYPSNCNATTVLTRCRKTWLVLWIFLHCICSGSSGYESCTMFLIHNVVCVHSRYCKYMSCIHEMLVCIPDQVKYFVSLPLSDWGWNPFDWYTSYDSFLVAQPLSRFLENRTSRCSGRNRVQSNIGSPGLTAVAIRLFLVTWLMQSRNDLWRTLRFWKSGALRLVGGNSNHLLFSLLAWGDDPIWLIYFKAVEATN